MKFGLHVPFLQAAANSPVLVNHPDWEAVDPAETGEYFGDASLCPSHKPARDWIISELNRVIQEYGVDWLTQDGQNMVKFCASASHTHAAGDSNYSNSVDGLDAILDSVQKTNPSVLWENSEDGGSMQTFHMIQRYVTSIANDASDALTTRHGVWGAISAFPPRYTERYMSDDPSDTYHTRSYMFGGPMILMNRITDWSGETLAFTKSEIDLYKSLRTAVRDSKIYHLMSQPDGTFNDAVEAYNQGTDQAYIFVYGSSPQVSEQYVEPRGLKPSSIYLVSFREAGSSYISSGESLMKRGFVVGLRPGMAEVISITPE
jgi:alpha-galactosidase